VPRVLTRAEVKTVVRAATLAPSVLNIQPWRFVARGDAIEVHTDQDRALPFLDPHRRAITVSCGAAVFNLRLAIAVERRRPGVELLPEGTNGSLLAVVHAGEDAESNATELRLYHAIPKRRTSRVPFIDEPLPPETVVALEEAAATERAMLRVLSSDEAFEIARLVHEADLAQRFDPRLRTEIVRWTDRGPVPSTVSRRRRLDRHLAMRRVWCVTLRSGCRFAAAKKLISSENQRSRCWPPSKTTQQLG
jgi:Nitroreductase family